MAGIWQRCWMWDCGCLVASAASTISTLAAAALSSGRRAATVQHVANQLERGGAHAAVLVHAKCDVKNGFAAMNGFGNHQLLVFTPGKSRRGDGNGASDLFHGVRSVQQPANQQAQRINDGRFGIALISGEQSLKSIGGDEDQFGESCAVCFAYQRDAEPPVVDPLRLLIRRLLHAPDSVEEITGSVTITPAAFAWSEYEQLMISEAIHRGETVFNVALRVDQNSGMRAAAFQLIRNVLHGCGTVIALRPEDNAAAANVEIVEAALDR